MTPKDPVLEGTFWDKFWRADSLPGAFVHSRKVCKNEGFFLTKLLFQGKSLGLIQHVLTVLVFWSGCCWYPGSRVRLGASDRAPELAFGA